MNKGFFYIVIFLIPSLVVSQQIQRKNYFDSDSSKIKEIFHYSSRDSALNGSYESFHLNGSLQTFGWYIKNLPDSTWNYFYENGRKKATGKYRKGLPYGVWKYYFENGNIKSEGRLNNDLKEGNWTYYFENGGEKNTGKYENGVKVGIWNYFYEDGSIKAQVAFMDQVGMYKEFYPFGNLRMEGETIDEKSAGEWVYYYESGEVEATGEFEAGLKTGLWKYFHKNGETKATGNYKQGKRDGNWKYYHENGALSQSGDIIEDQKDGYWKLFYPTGEVQGEVVFDHGSGLFSEYYISGKKKATGKMVEGKKEGTWIYYSENGQTEGEAEFKGGEGEYRGFYPDQSLKMSGKLKDDKRVGVWTLYNPDGSLAGTYTPIYENEKPIFKTRLSKDYASKNTDQFDSPEYKFKRRGLRYFQNRINEYRAVILGTNPAWLIDDQLPIAIEYYMQERLGYELQVDILRNPFFVSDENIGNYSLYKRGAKIHFRQKLYHENGKFGMFYFGHQLSYTNVNYQVNHADTLIFPTFQKFGSMVESGFSYGLFIGNRWMRDVGDSGLTVDFFLGVRVANRTYNRKFEPDPVLDVYFDPQVQSSVHFPIIFGLNIGFAGPDNKSKTQ